MDPNIDRGMQAMTPWFKRADRYVPVLVAALTFIVFLPTLENLFVDWDDHATLVDNYRYRGLGWEQLKWMFTTSHMGHYQPLSWVTFGLDHIVWGMDPFGYHLTSVLLHSVNAVVFYFVCLKLFSLVIKRASGEIEPGTYFAAGFAALVFAVHPLRVESVSWATERRDVLSGLFYLLSVWFYISARTSDRDRVSFWRLYALPLAALLLSLLSKGTAISLFITLLVLDVYPLGRLPGDPGLWFSRDARRIWLEKAPFAALAAIFGVIGYKWLLKVDFITSYEQLELFRRCGQIFSALAFYVWKTLVPVELSPVYRVPFGSGLLAGAGIAAVTVLLFMLRRRLPAGLAAWISYIAAAGPMLGLVKFTPAADRYTYIPCLGFAALAGAGFLACRKAVPGRHGSRCHAAALLVIIVLSGLTWRQEMVWRDSETLWRHALSVDPELDIAHLNLGVDLAMQDKVDEAVRHYLQAIRINPDSAAAHNNLGGIFAVQGRSDEAARHYKEVLRIDPGHRSAYANLGNVMLQQGKPDEAEKYYGEALKIDPHNQAARHNLEILRSLPRTGASASTGN
ncbi:MAG TPA: tetratricopeptide repeat protein [Elusimicrobiales bacterium]|nr:tetratricopeptide repeat protein [Elusimicrobiales bacterium]